MVLLEGERLVMMIMMMILGQYLYLLVVVYSIFVLVKRALVSCRAFNDSPYTTYSSGLQK